MNGSQLAAATSPVGVSSSPSLIAGKVAAMSDRAIQRVVGGSAFLRGRLYARRKSVQNLRDSGRLVQGEILVRSADGPYTTAVDFCEDGAFRSKCNCSAWRGPEHHCKHVAAILVALRDRERPHGVRRAPELSQESGGRAGANVIEVERTGSAGPAKATALVIEANGSSAAGTRSVGGSTKRRRSRRRRRGDASGLDTRRDREARAVTAFDAWIPATAAPKSLELEYRVAVRSASLCVSPVVSGAQAPVVIGDSLARFNALSASDRPLMRLLGRTATRSQASSAELRGEDAADALNQMRTRRVLLEPSLKELRFSQDPLIPRLELDRSGDQGMRVRVVFQPAGQARRFSLSQGAWFEGVPGWMVDTTDGVAWPLADSVTPVWLQRLFRSPSLVVPLDELPKLLTDFLPRAAASLGAELPKLDSVTTVVDEEPTFELRAEGDLFAARARMIVAYAGHSFEVPIHCLPSPLAFVVAAGSNASALATGANDAKPMVVRRQVGAELEALQRLLDAGLGRDTDDERWLVASGDDAVEFWTRGLRGLPEAWARYVPDDLANVTVRNQSVKPQMRVSSGVDWLNLDMVFSSGEVAADEDELRACLAHGRRLVRLKDGSYAPIDTASLGDVMHRMAEIVATSGNRKKLPLSQAGRVQDLMRVVGEAKATSTTNALFEKLDNPGEVPQLPKPRLLKAQLRPYQKQGFSWLAFLHQLGSGGILADDMGLGKTLQTLAFLLWVRGKEKRALNLVVAPTSVVPNWQREAEKFAPALKVVVWHGPDRQEVREELDSADIMVTNYALLRRDEELLGGLDFRYAILDEAQHIKNPLSHTARAAKKLRTKRRLALTGTPIENRLSEFWSIFDFVSPGMLGSLKSFEDEYAKPVDRGDAEAAERLRKAVAPFVLRRNKGDVARDLPEKIEQDIVVPMAEEQSKLYRQVLRQLRDSVLSKVDEQGLGKVQIQVLAALTRLRQIACDPRLTRLEGSWKDEESGKVSALREILTESQAGGHRVLVFSQFVEMLKLIRSMLEEVGMPYAYLDGATKDRMGEVERFNSDDSLTAFLISLKAGGSGLNLTGADTVVHFDPWWNPAVEDQATDRAHRIGQTRTVTVYRLIAGGSVEEKILQLSGKKRELVQNVFQSEGQSAKGLTRDDVDSLFSE